MRIKKYTARSMREALLQIKQDLGDDAVILRTRNVARKLLSLGNGQEIEVTAAVEDGTPGPVPMSPLRINPQGVYNRNGVQPKTGAAQDTAPGPAAAPRNPDSRFEYLELREDLREVKQLVKSILTSGAAASAGGFADGWAVLYKRLVDAEVKPDIATALIGHVKERYVVADNKIDSAFLAAIGDCFPVAGPLKIKKKGPLVVAFVGPTGAGKTTTLAKLAAHFVISKKRSAAVITADTYRIAAIEQIRTFADIVGIRLEVVFTPEEARDAVAACSSEDAIFIDTAGRSQRNTGHMAELKTLLSVIKPDETHLVLSATTKDSDLDDVIARYQDFGVNRLLFTKLDETARLGNIVNCVNTHRIPVSYFTAGQSVPDDIELAQPGRFMQRLWEGAVV